MKKSLIISIIAVSACSTLIFAHVEGGLEDVHDKPLEVVLEEIRAQQGIGKDERIDPEKVSDEQLEKLGDALMSVMHPDPREHEWMDNMMGGEGSTTLSAMHRIMGYNYLRGYYVGMMGPGMMGRGMMSGRSAYDPWQRGHGMMNTGYSNVFFWIILLVVIVVVIYVIVQTRTSRIAAPSKEIPLDILAKRYAKGEITKDDFERMKKDIT
jgi:uncharacterized membrane protein